MGIIDYSLIVDGMKSAMKSRRITYSQLAKAIHMSESGLKKIFASKDCSIRKLMQLCDALEISLVDILETEKSKRASTIQLNDLQQKAFLEDPLLFKVYWALTYDGLRLDEIKSNWSLEKSVLSKILRKLDKMNVLRWGPGDRIHLIAKDLPYWNDSGPFVEKIKREWSQKLLSDSLGKHKDQNLAHLSLRCLFLTEDSYKELSSSLRDLIIEFDRRTRREIALHGRRA